MEFESAVDTFLNNRDEAFINPIPMEILIELRAGYHPETRTVRFVLN